MDFLKAILGDDLYKQVSEKVNAFNGDEVNKDKQVKIVDLGSGEYVSKLKYSDLETSLSSKDEELSAANKLIGDLKSAGSGDEDLQGKVTEYENTVANLKSELADTKLKSAIKVALLSEKVTDVDYLTYKLDEELKAKGESLELDENEKIKGWDTRLESLKTQYPAWFGKDDGNADTKIDPQKLPDGSTRKTEPESLADALRMRDEEK